VLKVSFEQPNAEYRNRSTEQLSSPLHEIDLPWSIQPGNVGPNLASTYSLNKCVASDISFDNQLKVDEHQAILPAYMSRHPWVEKEGALLTVRQVLNVLGPVSSNLFPPRITTPSGRSFTQWASLRTKAAGSVSTTLHNNCVDVSEPDILPVTPWRFEREDVGDPIKGTTARLRKHNAHRLLTPGTVYIEPAMPDIKSNHITKYCTEVLGLKSEANDPDTCYLSDCDEDHTIPEAAVNFMVVWEKLAADVLGFLEKRQLERRLERRAARMNASQA